jgi:hypothetical protein
LTVGVILGRVSAGQSDSGPRAGSAPLPASLAGRNPGTSEPPATSVGTPTAGRGTVDSATHSPVVPAARPGVPARLDIPISTSAHPQGVHAYITANPLDPDGKLHVPADPQTVSWADQDAKPGASRGTAILTSHINYVINGSLVIGALSDLAIYAKQAIGKVITVELRDGRRLHYRIVAGREYTKDQLAGDAKLRRELYDQSSVYGPAARPSGRLLLVSCGGAFDAYTGEYEDNVFLYALPVT